MCDFEDACSPTWANLIEGQRNLRDAVRRTIALETAERRYALNAETATLVVRPRGWHLEERHLAVDGRPVSASLFDFGLAFFHNATELLARGSGPYFYLPKLESSDEARLWARTFALAEERARSPAGVDPLHGPVETILAAFEMDAILYELRDYGCALNAGRWDYIFSAIKKLGAVLPDRAQVTMAVPFMQSYTDLLVSSCHRRGAHAIGGMAAFIPSRRDPVVNDARARQGARGQAPRVGRRLRRHLGGTPGPRPGRDRGLRRRARPAPEPARAAARPTSTKTRPPSSTSPSRAARSPRTGSARTCRSGPATSTPGSTAPARPRSTT